MSHDIMSGMNIVSASPFHSISRSEIYISPDSEDREVFKSGTTRDSKGQWINLYAPAKIGIDRLMNAAGIEEIASSSKRVGDRIWEAEYTGSYIRPDGTEIKLTGSKEMDLTLGGPRWQAEHDKNMINLLYAEAKGVGVQQAGAWQDVAIEVRRKLEQDSPERLEELEYIADAKATHATNNSAKFGRELAETGARLRAVRSIMQIGTYTKEQLEEPFIIYSSRFDWDKMQQLLPQGSVQRLMTAHVAKTLGIDLDQIAQIPEEVEPKEEGRVVDVDFLEGTVVAESIYEAPLQEATDDRLADTLKKAGKSLASLTKSVFGEEAEEVGNARAMILIDYIDTLTAMKEKGWSTGQLRSLGNSLKKEIARAVGADEYPDFELILREREDANNDTE